MDTTKIANDIDGLADRQIKAGGMKLTAGSVMAIFAFMSTIVGGLYGGFVLYQKIEAVAGLDLEAYQQNMKDDILRIEQQTDRIEDMVRESEDKVRSMIDDAEVRFENQRERVRVSQSGSMKELEDRLMGKLQRALDNPLAD